MKCELSVSRSAAEIVSTLREQGFETYIVGGAVRDLLLGRNPKDFDISTSATPEEVRHVFGRRSSRIIGKRFRLVHVLLDGERFEVSTFRQAPHEAGRNERTIKNADQLPENLIVSDNAFGTPEEDAMRRDFTVNALFYDPGTRELIDHTGMGVEDIKRKTVRAIGDPKIRFEEDPVRMLRALKLVGQCDFSLESATENALFGSLELLRHASSSRLSLELEKILESCYGDRHFRVFHDYGLLEIFLPEFNHAWGTPPMRRALELLYERNCRVDERRYRNSVSLAMATVALPFVEARLGNAPGSLWKTSGAADEAISEILGFLFRPQNMMVRMTDSAVRILRMQPWFEESGREAELLDSRSYSHARELLLIRTATDGGDVAATDRKWPLRGTRRRQKSGRRR